MGQTFVIKSDGTLYGWGFNKWGQVGDGNNYTVALKKNGEVWVWGDNRRGLLGNGSYKSEYGPIKVLTGVSSISSGSNHVLALKDGELWAWDITMQVKLEMIPKRWTK